MNRFEVYKRLAWSVLFVGMLALAGGCDGSNGKDGADGARGADGAAGADGVSCWDLNANGVGDVLTEDINDDGVVNVDDCGIDTGSIAARVDKAQIESCATCHSGVGDDHQALYDRYTDGTPNGGSNLVIAFDAASLSVAGAGPYDVSVDFTITQSGQPLASLSALGVARFYVTEYVGGEFFQPTSLSGAGSNGNFTASGSVPFDPTTNASFFSYIADQQVIIDDVNYAAHMGLYDNAASAGFSTAGAEAYASAANVSGCEACHGTPYLKHGNRPAAVAGLPDFAACKACHYDDRNGGHPDWQWMVDDPFGWATEALTEAEVDAMYPYTANVMNDVHMSHAMEFPYPQSMANCATCHEGKLDVVLDNSNFAFQTCKSCHPLNGDPEYDDSHRAPAIGQLWAANNLTELHAGVDDTTDCTVCHGAGFARPFDEYHTGYDEYIYDDAGNRYANMYTASIDSIAYDDVNDTLTIDYSVSDPNVVPELMVSFYGWDSKDFLVPSHVRDANRNRFEYEPDPLEPNTNPLFTVDDTVAPPAYRTTANLAAYAPAPELLADIPTLIDDMDVTKIEVIVTPFIDIGLDDEISLNAVTATYDLVAGARVSNYFQGTSAIAGIDKDTGENKCNACHDQLAVTFHSGSGRAGEMTVCRSCHASTNPGSHLEMQSRSIESYVHAIHTFQAFDPGNIFGPNATFDPVDSERYALHIEHTFPNFTITNCEACHNEGTYNVPDQSKSMPGGLSASDAIAFWYDPANPSVEDPAGRNIGGVPEYVVGPASKACGGCHRAELINEDKAGDLAAFNAHTGTFGTLVENDVDDQDGTDTDDEVLYGVMKKIMTLFE